MIGKCKEFQMLKQIILTTTAISLLTAGVASAVNNSADVATQGTITPKDIRNYTGEAEPETSCTFNNRSKQEGSLIFNPIKKPEDHPRDQDFKSSWNSTFTSDDPVGIEVSYYGVSKLLISPQKSGQAIITQYNEVGRVGHTPDELSGIVSSITYNEVQAGAKDVSTTVPLSKAGLVINLPKEKNRHGYDIKTENLMITFKPTLKMAANWDAEAGTYTQRFTITCTQ